MDDAACWDVTMGGTKLTYGTDFTYNAGTNKFTITSVTGDVEIIVSAGHPVNWYAQGTKVATNVAAEGKISLPAAPSDCSASRQFVGWCTNSTYKSADTPPTYAKTGDVYSVANYYAVYADVSGGGSANATYTFSDKSWSASPSNWVSSKDGAGYINSGVQVTAKATGANATCPTSYSNISSIVVHYCTNASSGAGSIKMTVDGTDVSESVTSSGGTTPRDLEFDFSENTPTGTPKITVNCSTNSIYICGVTITYGSASYSGFSTDCTAPDPCALTSISLNTTGVKTAFTTGEVFTSDGLVVTANYSNCSSKTVTPTGVSTPDMSSIGNKTVTVTYTENAVTKTTTYPITVSAPTTYSIRFFDGATQLKAESLIMGATATPPTVDDCDEYEFIGWYTSTLDADNTTSYTWISDFTVSGTQNYYAVFSHSEGSGGGGSSSGRTTVSFVVDGEKGVVDSITGNIPVKVKLDEVNVPLKTGYVFDGWYLNEDMTEKADNDFSTSKAVTLYGKYVKYTAPDRLNTEKHMAYIIGYPEGDVRPENNISREEVATIIYRLLNEDYRDTILTTENDFPDVEPTRWSNRIISTMENGGYIRGYEDGAFRPGNPITRAEFVTIVSYFTNDPNKVAGSFMDISGHWAEERIRIATANGWIAGYEDGSFRPNNYITRAEAITIINRLLDRHVNAEGLHADAIQWPDNLEGMWYYYDMLEATNPHNHERFADGVYEKWTEITDWFPLLV